MPRRYRNILVVLCLPILGLAICLYVLLFDESRASRTRHIDRTLLEIQRGNYFAWGQVWMWMGRLTPREEKELTEACGHYALTNHVLHVTGIVWPPEPTPTTFRDWSAWVKGAVGMEDRTLAFDVIEFPPSRDIHLNTPEGFYRLPDSGGPTPAVAIPLATSLKPAAGPVR